jgi:hypothetical protein
LEKSPPSELKKIETALAQVLSIIS